MSSSGDKTNNLLNWPDFFHSNTATHTFSAPLLLDAMIFKNKELAIKYNTEKKLKGFSIVKVVPQYSFE